MEDFLSPGISCCEKSSLCWTKERERKEKCWRKNIWMALIPIEKKNPHGKLCAEILSSYVAAERLSSLREREFSKEKLTLIVTFSIKQVKISQIFGPKKKKSSFVWYQKFRFLWHLFVLFNPPPPCILKVFKFKGIFDFVFNFWILKGLISHLENSYSWSNTLNISMKKWSKRVRGIKNKVKERKKGLFLSLILWKICGISWCAVHFSFADLSLFWELYTLWRERCH